MFYWDLIEYYGSKTWTVSDPCLSYWGTDVFGKDGAVGDFAGCQYMGEAMCYG